MNVQQQQQVQAMDVDDVERQNKKDALRAEFGLSSDLLDEVLDCFELFDFNKNGTIEESELGQMFRGLGANPSDQEIKNALAKVDTNKNGVVDIHEFCRMFCKFMSMDWEERLLKAFRVFDKDNNGFVTREELESVYRSTRGGEDLDQEITDMMEVLDKNKDGLIHYSEMVALFCSRDHRG